MLDFWITVGWNLTFQSKNMISIWILLIGTMEAAPPTACLIVPFIATTTQSRDWGEFLAQGLQHLQCSGSTTSMYTIIFYPFVFVLFPLWTSKAGLLAHTTINVCRRHWVQPRVDQLSVKSNFFMCLNSFFIAICP